jgi:hypothetical protein
MNVRLKLALIASLATGCEAARMAVPADIASASEELAITDRSSWTGALADESFNLGSYKVADVDRKWDSKETTSLGAMESTTSAGGYKFKLIGGVGPLDGVCESENRGRSADLGGGLSFGSMVAKLVCRCSDASGAAELSVEASTANAYEGVLKRADGALHVRSINEREGGGDTHDPTGYRVDGEGAPLGAVDVMGKGRVWISKTLQGHQRDELACLFAGLLLYQAPKER